MTTPTQENLLDCLPCGREPATLQEYAAYYAAKELSSNWKDAVKDGTPLFDILSDVDEVVEILQEWKEKVQQTYCQLARRQENIKAPEWTDEDNCRSFQYYLRKT